MRRRLLQAFDKIWIDNLHGDRIISERTPNGNTCETIFSVSGQGPGIKIGTAISTLVKRGLHPRPSSGVYYRDVWGMPDDPTTWGRAERKRAALVWSSQLPSDRLQALYQAIMPEKPSRFMLKPGGSEGAYLSWKLLPTIFPTYYPGFKTSRDPDLISIDPMPLKERMRAYFDASLSDEQVAQVAPELMEDASRFDAKATRRELLRTSRYRDDHLLHVAYRPLDNRWLYWEGTTKLLDEKRRDFYEQVQPGNLYLVANAGSRRDGSHTYLSDKFVCLDLLDRNALCFPLRINTALMGQANVHPNISQDVLNVLREVWRTDDTTLAEAMFYHALAVMKSPLYYDENKNLIMQDWPRIPIPATRERLEASARLGRQVGDLLRPDVPFTPAPELRGLAMPARKDGGQLGDADMSVTVRYNGVGRYDPAIADGAGQRPARLWWNDVGYWNDVPANVWAFTIGGYPVIKKWLDYRHIEKLKRPMRLEEVRYVMEMTQRIAALLALGPSLDENYQAVKAEAMAAVGAKETT